MLFTYRDLDCDLSGLNLNDQDAITMTSYLFDLNTEIRRKILGKAKVKGRTALSKKFTRGYKEELGKALGVSFWDPAVERQQEADCRDAAKEALENGVSVYELMSVHFRIEPDRVLWGLEKHCNIVPDGLQINLTTQPTWL